MFLRVLLHVVASTPPAIRPAPDTKSKSKAAAQSVPAPVTKAIVIASLQYTFAYLARAAVRVQSIYVFVCIEQCYLYSHAFVMRLWEFRLHYNRKIDEY